MKKVLRMVKNKLVVVGTFLLSLPTKVFAISDYMMRPDILYGIPEPKQPVNSVWSNIWNICKIFIIPIALLVGIIIYIKKSKNSKKRKVVTVLIVLAIVTLIYLGMNYLVKEVL